jgi:2-dehydro-3-deoxygluconokinase
MKQAKALGLKVSFDFNYRTKLMKLEDAKQVYPEIVQYADIVSASAWDIQTLLGFHPDETDQDKLFEDACRELGFEYIFTRKRTVISSREQKLQAFAYTKDKKVIGKEYKFEIFDRIGAGDAFVAGYLHGLLKDETDLVSALRYGIANCVMEQTILGDCARFSEHQLDRFLETSGLEEMQR